MRKRKQTDRADAVIRLSIDGLDEEAVAEAFTRANREACERLNAPAYAKRFRAPIKISLMNSEGRCLWTLNGKDSDISEEFMNGEAGETETLFFFVAEDCRGERVCARIEVERQTVQ